MDFAAHSDPFVYYAYRAGVAALALAGLTLLAVVVLRTATAWRERRKRRLIEVWRPLMAQALAGEQVQIAQVARRDLADFLYLWLHFHESLRGQAKTALNGLLQRLSLLEPMCRLLTSGSLQEQLLTAIALGHAQCREAWPRLAALAQDAGPALSIVSARALMKIDAAEAADIVIPLIIRRRDWSAAKLASMLNEAEPVFAQRFLDAVAQAAQRNEPYLTRLLHLVEAMGLNRRLPFVRELLRGSDNAEAISAALRMANDPQDIALVRMRARDADWRVRVQAANALGRMGNADDVPVLVELMAAPEWWVRYRAAQAIAGLPFMQPAQLAQLEAGISDRYARDMLRQVRSEREAA